jgi:hypothetical protein
MGPRLSEKVGTMNTKNHVFTAAFALLTVSFVASAEQPAGETSAASQTPKAPLPFRGSSVGYSHSITAYTIAPGAEPFYNPTWGHRLALMPEWHFNDQLFVRGKLYLSQEFTKSDTTNYSNEIELSDLLLDVGATGFTEPKTGLHVGGDVRLGFPTSKASQAQTRVLTLGPALTVSRDFKILHGLNVAYTGRFTYRFNRFTTSQTSSVPIANCNVQHTTDCTGAEVVTVSDGRQLTPSTGHRNGNYDLAHGPNITFAPLEKLSFNAMFLWQHVWLYPVAPAAGALGGAEGLGATGVDVKNLSIFALSASWQLTKPVSLTFGSWTVAGQPGADGQYVFPLFNRNTTVYLDASFDIEAAASSFL